MFSNVKAQNKSPFGKGGSSFAKRVYMIVKRNCRFIKNRNVNFALQKQNCRILPAVTGCLLFIVFSSALGAGAAQEDATQMRWGGHLRAIGSLAAIDDQSIYAQVDTGPYYDGQGELRLKNEIFLGSRWSLETHYELVAAGGDTRANTSKLQQRYPAPALDALIAPTQINDDHRLFDLTHPLISEDDYVVYHRIDRLNLTFSPSWGSIRLGRQALTWGNGMVFNPMDLFNPFAPTTVQRDYKVGDDMALGQVYLGNHEMQLLYLPRRDPEDGEIDDDRGSYAGKAHLIFGALETELMAARHYDDTVYGWGAIGYLGDAAWRLNAVYTSVSDQYNQKDFFQTVANMDYAWQWADKNIYGLLEFYYNGLGEKDDYLQAAAAPYTFNRLARGDLFTLGRYYMAALLQIELHPLVHNYWTCITNLEDPSGLVLPQMIWDATTNTQLILGGQWHWGADDTEYGGSKTSFLGETIRIAPQDQVYVWLTYSF